MGSGIKRALENWTEIDFNDDRDGCLFSVVVHRKKIVSSDKTREKMMLLIENNPLITANEMADSLEMSVKGIEWQLNNLKKQKILKRVGPDKGGHWEVIK